MSRETFGVNVLQFIIAILLLTSCAGPTNPFGSTLLKKSPKYLSKYTETNDLKISIFPKRQNLHDSHHMKLIVETADTRVDKVNVFVFWNGQDISKSFHKTTKVEVLKNKTIFSFKDMRLQSSKNHKIEFYVSHRGRNYYHNYKLPTCNIYEKREVTNTGRFDVDDDLLNDIQQSAFFHDINPSLLTGLIAAESSFKTRAVSSAKAIGLTQVTNLGHLEIKKKYPDWKIDKRTMRFPASIVKTLVNMNKIDSNDDWRLNERKSIVGGSSYLIFLKDYWEKKALKLDVGTGDMTNLILASYNSGAARVKSQLQRHKKAWRKSRKLKEANKYINRISSYCYHFSSDDNEI